MDPEARLEHRKAGIVRLLEILHQLCADPVGIRPRDLAVRFDVSERTAFRDLARLEEAGIPLYRDDGRIKLLESPAAGMLRRKLGGCAGDEVRIKVRRGRRRELARALVPWMDVLERIEPDGFEEELRSEAERLACLFRQRKSDRSSDRGRP